MKLENKLQSTTETTLYQTISTGSIRNTPASYPGLSRSYFSLFSSQVYRHSDPSQPISGCLETFTENSLLYSVFLLTLSLITF